MVIRLPQHGFGEPTYQCMVPSFTYRYTHITNEKKLLIHSSYTSFFTFCPFTIELDEIPTSSSSSGSNYFWDPFNQSHHSLSSSLRQIRHNRCTHPGKKPNNNPSQEINGSKYNMIVKHVHIPLFLHIFVFLLKALLHHLHIAYTISLIKNTWSDIHCFDQFLWLYQKFWHLPFCDQCMPVVIPPLWCAHCHPYQSKKRQPWALLLSGACSSSM